MSAVSRGCKYKLGAGGRLWHKGTPWTPALMTCDCSGFVAWCIGEDRHTNHPWYRALNGGWLETTAILRDAREPAFGMFAEVAWEAALPGDFLVWGDSGGKQGHVGIVTTVGGALHRGPTLVAHCSMGNWRQTKDAIGVTDATIFLSHGAAVARCALVA